MKARQLSFLLIADNLINEKEKIRNEKEKEIGRGHAS